MLGESVRPRSESAPAWQPVGEASFQPLVATVQELRSGRLLQPSEIAALQPGDVALGETVLEGAIHAWRRRMLASCGQSATERLVLGSSCGVGGRNIEALSKGASPELFNRMRDCVALGRQLAEAAGKSYGVSALLMLQGEANAWGVGVSDREGYGAMLRRLHEDFALEVAADPAVPMFTYQTGGPYSSEDLWVAQAQLDICLDAPRRYLVAPTYPVPTKAAGHLDANGYRWLGAQFGKVMHRVLTRGEQWRPLYPVSAVTRDNQLDIDFHVPVAPLAWSEPIAGLSRRTLPDKGFTVRDETGLVPIVDIALAGATRVTLRLARPVAAQARALYADKRNLGRGHLHDSDDEVAYDRYEFDPKAGHYPEADIPGLTGKPYPLVNWCVAFNIPIAAEVSPVPQFPIAAAVPRKGWLARLLELFSR